MPASMMMAPAGFMLKVSGSSIAIVAGGPSPGRIPTTVPRSTPTKHQNRLAGSSATANPFRRPARISTLETQNAHREGHAERSVEHEIESARARDRRERRGCERPAVHHRHDEVGQQRKTDHETERFEKRNRHCEGEPGRERPAELGPVDRIPASVSSPEVRDDEQHRKREHRDAVPKWEEAGAGPLGAEILPLPRLDDDVEAERRERNARPQVSRLAGSVLHASPPKRLRLFFRGFLVAALGDDLAYGAPGRPEFDRNHPGVADDLATEGLYFFFSFLEIVHFHGEVMDAGAFARGLRLGGPGVRVVLHDRKIDDSVGKMARSMIADPFRLGFLESENLLVELGGALQVVDLQRDVHDAIHGLSKKSPLSLRERARVRGRAAAV